MCAGLQCFPRVRAAVGVARPLIASSLSHRVLILTVTTAVSIKSVSPLLQVADLQRSRKLYADTLGFTENWFDGEGFAIVCRDGCTLFLAQKQVEVDLRNLAARAARDGYANYDLHFNCEAGTVDGLWAEYRDAGARIADAFANGPIDRDYGIRDFSVIDPDGYELVFGAPLEDGAG